MKISDHLPNDLSSKVNELMTWGLFLGMKKKWRYFNILTPFHVILLVFIDYKDWPWFQFIFYCHILITNHDNKQLEWWKVRLNLENLVYDLFIPNVVMIRTLKRSE